MKPAAFFSRSAFTLVEMVVTVAIIGILATLLISSISSSMKQARRLECMANLRAIGGGIQGYLFDNQNEFPTSSHNAWALGKEAWGSAIVPYLKETPPPGASATWFYEQYRCPEDKRVSTTVRSYALNVFFNLRSGDIYDGSPTTWWNLASVPRPASTVLVAENRGGADHFMAHQWTTIRGASNAIATTRHVKNANYLFVDGHVESLMLSDTFDIQKSINRWNPSLAR